MAKTKSTPHATAPTLTPESLARISRDHAQRIAALWQKPILADAEIAEAIGLPYSSWQALKGKKDIPPLFNLGRRVYANTENVRAWLNSKTK